MGNSSAKDTNQQDDKDNDPLIGAVIKEGELLKRARRSGRNWKKRWIQLVQIDMHSGALVYFDSKPTSLTQKPNGRIEICKNTTCIATRKFEKGDQRKRHCFMLSRPDNDYTFYAACTTRIEVLSWVKAIEDLVDKFSKILFNRRSKKIYAMQGTLKGKVSKQLRQSMSENAKQHQHNNNMDTLEYISHDTKSFEDEMMQEEKLRNLLMDLWKGEEAYHVTLKLLCETFVPIMQKHKVDTHNVMVFSHIEQVKELHSFLIAELRSCVQNIEDESNFSDVSGLYNIVSHVAGVFSRYAPFFLIYVSVVKKLPASTAAVQRKMKQKSDFRVAMEVAEMDPRCENLDFHSLAIKLVQRIPHYNLILKDFLKCTPRDSTDAYENLVLAQAKLTEVIAKLDHNAQTGWKVCGGGGYARATDFMFFPFFTLIFTCTNPHHHHHHNDILNFLS